MLHHLTLNKTTQILWTSLISLHERKLFAIKEIQNSHSKGTPRDVFYTEKE